MTSGRLKDLRISRNITQAKLARMLNVTQTAIAKWEKGQTKPDFQNQRRLADIYGISIDELFGRQVPSANTDQRIADNNSMDYCNGESPGINLQPELTAQEKEILRIFRESTPKAQTKILNYMYAIEDAPITLPSKAEIAELADWNNSATPPIDLPHYIPSTDITPRDADDIAFFLLDSEDKKLVRAIVRQQLRKDKYKGSSKRDAFAFAAQEEHMSQPVTIVEDEKTIKFLEQLRTSKEK